MLLDNLLENAARHGRPGGHVRVSLAEAEDGAALLLVDDDGPGIPAEERERVLGRFARGEGARGAGTGLGLAIAAAQAARHGGAPALEDSELGGLRARVELRGVAERRLGRREAHDAGLVLDLGDASASTSRSMCPRTSESVR